MFEIINETNEDIKELSDIKIVLESYRNRKSWTSIFQCYNCR